MGMAIQATKEFQENQGRQDILVNGVALDFQECVMYLCVTRHTTSGNITAKGPVSDETAG